MAGGDPVACDPCRVGQLIRVRRAELNEDYRPYYAEPADSWEINILRSRLFEVRFCPQGHHSCRLSGLPGDQP